MAKVKFKVDSLVEIKKTSMKRYRQNPIEYGFQNIGRVKKTFVEEGVGTVCIVLFNSIDKSVKVSGERIKELVTNIMEKDLQVPSVSVTEEVVEVPKQEVVNKRINITATREGGKTLFSFDVDERITKIYEEQSQEIRDSGKWAGLKFYFVPSVINSQQYKDKLAEFDLFDDFGSGLIREGKMNIAWLRTVGSKGTIIVEDEIGFAHLSMLTKNCIAFLKDYFNDYYKEFIIKGSISIEV